MKIIKKIAAIILSVMMVLGMCSVVGAEGTGTTSGTLAPKGSITINNAAKGETYNIYRILDLESYSGNNYAYKLRTYDSSSTYNWNTFINSGDIKDKYVTIDGDYVTWKNKVETTADKAAEFAQKALKYAQDSTKIAPSNTTAATTSTVTFDNLPLGYYLVETSVGTVLALNTTNSTWTIEDKNKAPTVEKKVKSGESYEDNSTASIGNTVNFKTTITAQAGAQNYVLHDKMDAGLTFDKSTVKVRRQVGDGSATNVETGYIVKTDNLGETTPNVCTFHIEFDKTFCDGLQANEKIIITYSATLNEKAKIGKTTGNTNTTYLKYGDSSQTQDSTTTTYTFEIPVLKYTNKGTPATETPLANAKFKLSKDENGTTPIELVNITNSGEIDNTYRKAKTAEDTSITKITEIITPDSGKLRIQGLAAGTYYLTETQQPDGYNILKEAIKIEIDKDGNIKYASKSKTLNPMTSGGNVKVLNKTGSLLPSTGGMGTTLFYIFGAILVIGSGVVLITKKRMK